MTTVDIIILATVCLAGFLGYRSGLIKKILGIASFIVGLIAATKLMGPIGRAISNSFSLSIDVSYIFAFFLVFAAIIVLQNIISKKVGKVGGGAGLVNRLGGTILGIFQGTLALSLILIMFSVFSLPRESTRTNSILYKPTLNFAPLLFDLFNTFLPESRSFYEELKKNLTKHETQLP